MAFDELGYASAAIDVLPHVRAAQARRRRPAGAAASRSRCRRRSRPVSAFVALEYQAALEPVYEAQMRKEVERILAAIPADQLAIQWDARYEFAMLEGAIAVWFERRAAPASSSACCGSAAHRARRRRARLPPLLRRRRARPLRRARTTPAGWSASPTRSRPPRPAAELDPHAGAAASATTTPTSRRSASCACRPETELYLGLHPRRRPRRGRAAPDRGRAPARRRSSAWRPSAAGAAAAPPPSTACWRCTAG